MSHTDCRGWGVGTTRFTGKIKNDFRRKGRAEMANCTEMVSFTKGYRPYKFREARFWQKVIHSFSQ